VHASLLIEAAILAIVILDSSGKSPQHLSEVCVERIEQHGLSPFIRFDIRLNSLRSAGTFTQIKSPSLGAGAFLRNSDEAELSHARTPVQSDEIRPQHFRRFTGSESLIADWILEPHRFLRQSSTYLTID
jgi:hypothetical protein